MASTYHAALTTATVDERVISDYNHRVYRELRIAVVIPAFNERGKIAATVATVPARVDVIRHAANRGVGGAITTGYRRALEIGADIAVVMAGDGQMDPGDLPALLAPLAAGEADYVKGLS